MCPKTLWLATSQPKQGSPTGQVLDINDNEYSMFSRPTVIGDALQTEA